MMQNLGYEIDLIPAEQWYEIMIESIQQSEDHTLYPFLSLLESDLSDDGSNEKIVHEASFDCMLTTEMLRGSGISCPVVDEALLKVYFNHFARTGFISKHDVEAEVRTGGA